MFALLEIFITVDGSKFSFPLQLKEMKWKYQSSNCEIRFIGRIRKTSEDYLQL